MPMIIGCGLMLLQQWSGNNAVIFFCSSIFKTAGLDNTDQASLYVMATQVIATGLSVYLMDKAGRRLLMLMASVGMAAASGTLGFLFLLQHGSQKPPGWITIIALITYIIFFSIGMGPIPWLITGEIFPNRTRALGSSVATMVNWFSAFGVTFLFANMEESLQDYGTFWSLIVAQNVQKYNDSKPTVKNVFQHLVLNFIVKLSKNTVFLGNVHKGVL